jgi:hypothetical protein
MSLDVLDIQADVYAQNGFLGTRWRVQPRPIT